MTSIRAKVRTPALRAAFKVAELVPGPVKATLRRGPLGRVAGRFLASNSVGAADAFGSEELASALRAMVPEGAPSYGMLLDPSSRSRVLAASPVTIDLAAADDRQTVNALNLIRHAGSGSPWVLPSSSLLADSKQSVGPYVNGGGVRTVARIHNYFAKNYAIKDAVLVVVFADTGALWPLASFVLDADETVTWASTADHPAATVADGATLVFLAVSPAMRRVPTREFRLIVTIETDRGCAAVHSLPASRFEVAQPASNGTKGYLTPETRSLHLGEASIVWDGSEPVTTSGGTIRVASPGGDGAGWGAAVCSFDAPVRSTPRFYIATGDDQHLLLHHDQGPHPKPERRLAPSERFHASRHLFRHAIPLLHHKDVDLSIVVDPRNMSNSYRTLHVAVCDDDGSVRAERNVELEGPLTIVDTAGMRRQASLPSTSCGYVRVEPVHEGAEIRDLDDAVMLFGFYRADGHLLDTVESGTSPYADYEPIVEEGFRDARAMAQRANKFAPLHPDPAVRTRIWSANVGASRLAADAPLTLTLRWRGGAAVRRYVLAPDQARLWDLDEEFDLDPDHRPDAAVWLESSAANLFAIYLYDDGRDRLRFGLDHLTGG